jgi:hypothetical protein
MSTDLDDKIRTIVRRLDELTPIAPEFETLRTVGPSNERPRHLLVPALVAAAAVLLIALVVVVRHPDTSSGASLTPRSVATALPDGWVALGAGEGSVDAVPQAGPGAYVYATRSAPFGAVVAFMPFSNSMIDISQPSTERTRANGLRTVVGSAFLGSARSVDVEVSAGSWVNFVATGLTDEELFQLVEFVVVDGDVAQLAGPLPSGLVLVSRTFGLFDPLLSSPDSATAGWPAGMTMSLYGPTGGEADTYVSIRPASIDTLITLALTRQLRDRGDGMIEATAKDDDGTYVFTERDGYAVWARSTSLTHDGLASLVRSLTPASDDEWSSLLATGVIDRSDDTSASPDTTGVDAPAVSEAPMPEDAERSVVDLDYSALVDGTMSAALPDGQTVVVHLEPMGPTLRVWTTRQPSAASHSTSTATAATAAS